MKPDLKKINCLLLALLIVQVHFSYAQVNQTGAARPNILFIISDDHAYQEIGVYGSKIAKTPNIDRIAKEGAVFKNSFVTNSLCGPSRATLLTGKYSHINGYKANEGRFVDQETYPKILQQNNYETAWIGKMHLGNLPKGFDYFNILPGQGHYYNPDFINNNNDTVRHTGYITNIITDLTVEWLSKRKSSKPFCLVVGEKATHRQWLPDIQDLGAFDDVDFPLPPTFHDDYKGRTAALNQDMTVDKTMLLKEDLKIHADYKGGPVYRRLNAEQKKAYEDYYGKISREFDQKQLTGNKLAEWKYQRYLKDYLSVAKSLDRNIGEILNYLDKSGLAKNTVVIYVSDQGFYMGEHGWFDKRFIYEESLRTPFVMRYPGVIKPGTVINKFAVNIDWAPTILSIAGAKVPAGMQGVSLLPIFNGNANTPWKNEVYYHYYEYPAPHRVSAHFGIRDERYKLICFYSGKKVWELFDLQKDPNEINNIYDKKESAEMISRLKKRLLLQIKQYKDTEAQKIFEGSERTAAD